MILFEIQLYFLFLTEKVRYFFINVSHRNDKPDYMFADERKRHGLALAWLYQEYVYANGYLSILDQNKKKDFTLCRLREYLQEKANQRDG
jgi:hypothetical protein